MRWQPRWVDLILFERLRQTSSFEFCQWERSTFDSIGLVCWCLAESAELSRHNIKKPVGTTPGLHLWNRDSKCLSRHWTASENLFLHWPLELLNKYDQTRRESEMKCILSLLDERTPWLMQLQYRGRHILKKSIWWSILQGIAKFYTVLLHFHEIIKHLSCSRILRKRIPELISPHPLEVVLQYVASSDWTAPDISNTCM